MVDLLLAKRDDVRSIVASWLASDQVNISSESAAYVQNVMVSRLMGQRLSWPDEPMLMRFVRTMSTLKSGRLAELTDVADEALVVRSLFGQRLKLMNIGEVAEQVGMSAYASAARDVGQTSWRGIFDELAFKFSSITRALEKGWETSLAANDSSFSGKKTAAGLFVVLS